MKLSQLIASDLDRYAETYRLRGQPYSKSKIFWESLLFKPGFKAVFLYRLSHACHLKRWTYVAWWLARVNQRRTGAEIEFNARIGPGLLIAHPSGIVIGRGTVIGAQATLFQGVTFGARSWRQDEIGLFPTAGDRCFFFAHAVVIGGITLGDRAVVGANSLVNQDVPAGALAAGVPAVLHEGKGEAMIRSLEASR